MRSGKRGLSAMSPKISSAMLLPQIMQSRSAPGTIAHHALRFRSIDDFPGFADARAGRESFSEQRLEASPAPDPFHEKRFKDERP